MCIKISKINSKRNLLAFSAGVDSSALFFILLNNNINFDIAIVNYNIREQSKEEVSYAKELAKKYNKKIFIKELNLENQSNFEKKARDIRYDFFKDIIKENHYETLITAHQLNDKLEWFFMQLSKGSGLVELLGFEEFSENDGFKIFRPLINISKKELLNYLEKNKIKYFVDQSNFDEIYTRNFFRKNFANSFLENFQEGVSKSFDYLNLDLKSLNIDNNTILKIEELEIFKSTVDNNINIRIIDKNLKKRGFLLSKEQREEIVKQKEIVISHKVTVSIGEKYIYIAPYEKCIMPKKFKELCRIKKIPKKIRAYIFKKNILNKLML